MMRTELVKLTKSIQCTVLVWFLEPQNDEWGKRKYSCFPLGPAIRPLTAAWPFELGLESALELVREEVHLLLNRDTTGITYFVADLIIDSQYNVYLIYQVGSCDS